ncbi:MAG: hypothetical protein V1913_00115 [Fibrobacterota bacterium]
MADSNLKKMAAKLAAVAGKKQLDNKDMTILREVKDSISAVLQGLKECDCCGAAVTEIARLELDGVRAAVCQSCGIKALKNKSLVIKNVKKKEAARHEAAHERHVAGPAKHAAPAHAVPGAKGHAPVKVHDHRALAKKNPFKTEPHPAARPASAEPEQPSLFSGADDASGKSDNSVAFEEIARACNSKILIVKKIHQLANAIAFPMNLDRTVSYVRMEAQGQGVNLSNDELRKMIGLLIERAGVKVKE